MPGYVLPTALAVARAITVNGVRHAEGSVLQPADVVQIKCLDALLSNGSLMPFPDPHQRRFSNRQPPHTATSTGAVVRRAMIAAG